MPSLVVANAAQLRLIWQNTGADYAVNLLGVVAPAGVVIDQARANTISTAVMSAFTTSGLAAVVGSAITLSRIGIRDLRSAFLAEYVGTAAPVAGTATGDLLPPGVALCITIRTAFAGKSFRGRVYLCGFTEANNQPGGGAAAGVATAGAAFIVAIKSALVTSGMDLGVLSRPNDQLTPPKPGFITPATTAVSRDLTWEYQRRRAIPGI